MINTSLEKTCYDLMDQCSTGTTSHQHSRPPHQPPGHDLVIDLAGPGHYSAHRRPARVTASTEMEPVTSPIRTFGPLAAATRRLVWKPGAAADTPLIREDSMKKRLVVLGAGTAGTMVANKLRRRLSTSDWDITIVDRDDQHHYQPGYLF